MSFLFTLHIFFFIVCCLLWFSSSISYLQLSFLKFMCNLLHHVWFQWGGGIPFYLHSISKFMQNAEIFSFLAYAQPVHALYLWRMFWYYDIRHVRHQCHFNLLHTTGLFLYPLKTSENRRFPDASRGYKKRPVARNGLSEKKHRAEFESKWFSVWFLVKNRLLKALEKEWKV